MTGSSWASEARGAKWCQDQESQQATDIIEALVDGTVNAFPAAKQVTSIYEPLVKAKPISVTDIWSILFRAVRGVCIDEAAAKRLVSFVFCIQKEGRILDSSGEQVKLNRQVIWYDLPEFYYGFRLYGIYIEHPDDHQGDWLSQAPLLLNATTFGAVFMEEGHPKKHMSFLTSCSLIDGVEVAYSQDQAERATMFIAPAVVWVSLAGKSLHRLCNDRFSRSATRGIVETGNQWLWTGRVGFSPERWNFWKQRFGELASQESLNEHLQVLARKAESVMRDIEG